ncbi:Bsd2 protein [Martiniozyma asiatica (nom. inval.)]|nr:Bsd2 protein [Martiniozyma asiatica]
MEQARHIWNNAPLLRYLNPHSRYNQLPAENVIETHRDGHTITANDGVFSNLAAKPTTDAPVASELPSYNEASDDPTPPYWETSVMSEFDEVYIDGIPVGSIINLIWNVVVSITFQFVGFVITYLLHTSHAAKNGSQIGLGLTFINLGLYSLPVNVHKHDVDLKKDRFEPLDPGAIDVDTSSILDVDIDGFQSQINSKASADDNSILAGKPVVGYLLFILGGFIIIKAIRDFYHVKRLEYQITHPTTSNAEGVASVEETV